MDPTARLLIVDGDSATRQSYLDGLRGEGYEVNEAASGQQGLELAHQWHPDIVLLSVALPDLSGTEVCRQIKADPAVASILVVLLTADGTRVCPSNVALDSGADESLPHSIGSDDLTCRLRTLVRLCHATAALRTSETHFRSIIEMLPDSVVLTDLRGRIWKVNSKVVQRLGYARAEELLGETLFDLVPPADHGRLQADLMRVLQGDAPLRTEYAVLRKCGQPLEAEMSTSVLRDTTGRAEGLLIAGRDITEHRQTVAALREEEAKFRALIQAIPAVTWLGDEAGAATFISDNVEQVYGFTSDEIYRGGAAAWLGRIHPDDRPGVEAQYQALFRGQGFDVEYRYQHKDGHWVWVNDKSVSVFEQDGAKYARGVFFDITERKNAEILLRAQRALGVKLASTSELQAALEALLEIALEVGGIDCGGVYLVDEASGGCNLVAHRGVSAAFVSAIAHFDADSPQVRLMRLGQAVYNSHASLAGKLEFAPQREEGLRTDALIPLADQGNLVGAVVLASHTADDIPATKRVALEAIAAQAAGAVIRIRAEHSRRASEERYRSLAEWSPDAIFILDRERRLTFVNPAGAALLGRRPEELINRCESELFPPETSQLHAGFVAGVFENGRVEQREETIHLPGRTRAASSA